MMSLFATAQPLATHLELDLWAQVIFLFFLPLVCFVTVSGYVARCLRAGQFVNGVNAPFPLRLPLGTGCFFALTVLYLLFLHSVIYFLVVLIGLAVFQLETGKSAQELFGLERLSAGRLVKWSLLICGAVIFVEIPLDQVVQAGFEAVHMPHPEQETVTAFRQLGAAWQMAFFLFQAVVLAPLFEELFFRGFLQSFLKNYTSTWMALVLSAGVFAFAHVNLGAVLQLWLLGVALGLAYEHTGALLLPVGIHGCFNFATALNLLLEKGTS